MKNQIIGVLSFLVLFAAVAPIARAETVEATPFQLISLAQDGYLKNQGIPKGSTFINEYQEGRITPNDLVQAAIRDNRLTENTLHDRAYLNSVTQQMRDQLDNSRVSKGGDR